MLLYLITHAHTQQDPATASREWTLSTQGTLQAWVLARQALWSEVDCIVLSSERKTKLTVEQVLRERQLPVRRDSRFDELIRPDYVGDYLPRVESAFANPDVGVGAWESASSARRRFLCGIDALCRQCAGRTVALVGHGLTFSLYRAHLLGRATVELEAWRALTFCSVARVDPIAGRLERDFEAVAPSPPRV